jgi:hypothetical protein
MSFIGRILYCSQTAKRNNGAQRPQSVAPMLKEALKKRTGSGLKASTALPCSAEATPAGSDRRPSTA